jgi:hypothetical protein
MSDKPDALEFAQLEANVWRMKYLMVQQELREAVAAERKACEQACLDLKYDGDWSDCAEAIRARGEKS